MLLMWCFGVSSVLGWLLVWACVLSVAVSVVVVLLSVVARASVIWCGDSRGAVVQVVDGGFGLGLLCEVSGRR
ncbi:hypothetical protein BIV57_18815 [Mangrovactinospora gilvigrisea]|uniref:Uncharacterized protein n=1 Tax=Mangrovactinospora gilvigrisea TaxID=1428644 RepID=A0A1J7C329_9ACTN|nr:hypothetical protein BIV57_18815 [Mangrovactinospora gilvigrisea]